MPTRNESPRRPASPQLPLGAQAQSDPLPSQTEANPRNTVPQARSRREPENTLRPANDRATAVSANNRTAEPSTEVASNAQRESDPKSNRSVPAPSSTLPSHILNRYVQVNDTFHFENGERAFRVSPNKLSTPLENSEVIRDLIEIAQAHGWTRIKLAGTETFHKEAWQQANLAGLTVAGYRPSKLEEALLARRRAVDWTPDTGRTSGAAFQDSVATPRGPRETPTQHTLPNRAEAPAPSEDRVYTGKLMAHGIGAREFNPEEEASYFVRLQTPEGPKLLWGNDLQRALEQSLSKVKVGDQVTLRDRGEQPITVSRPILDTQGNPVRDSRVKARVNEWSAETVEFLRERAELARWVRGPTVDARTAVAKHPALAGTFTELHFAQLKAQEQYNSPQDQLRFVAIVRQKLADSIERGEALSTARVQPPIRTRDPSTLPNRNREQFQERTL